MSPERPTDPTGWSGVLAELEARIRHTGQPVADGPLGEDEMAIDWRAPDGLGPIPVDLLDHARQILEAQRMRIDNLRSVRESTGRHLAAIRSIESARQSGAAIYLDTTG